MIPTTTTAIGNANRRRPSRSGWIANTESTSATGTVMGTWEALG